MLEGLTQFVDGHDWPAALTAASACVLVQSAGFVAYLKSRGREQRRSADTKLREAIEAMPEGLAFYDADDRIVVWNRRYAELNDEGGGLLKLGASFRSLLEAGLKTGVYPEADGRQAEWLDARLAQRRAGHVEIEQENKGHWLRIIERRTSDGGTVSVCEDITELKAREASLRMMFEGSPVPMWIWNPAEDRFLDLNKAAITHYGWDRQTFLGMSMADVIAPEDHPRYRKLKDAEPTDDHTEALKAWRHVRADGSRITIEPYFQSHVRDGVEIVILALFDVTVREEAKQAMSDARDQAEAASRAKGEFLANMSHEIRTPLNGVTGVAQVLARTPLSAQQQEMVRIIESSADTLERLLSDILDLARVESGRIVIEAEPFDLGETVRATAALSEMRAREKGLGFDVRIDAGAEGCVVGDAGRLKQILYNLLSNAVKFTEAGNVTLTVAADQAVSPPMLSFRVSDTGVGFDPGFKDRLFGRFEQEDGSITRRFGGTGLGLAISRDLAELMGGRLDASAERGRGATFTLELPMARTDAEPRPEREEAPALISTEARPLRVLLAEDHPINQKVVELMLAPLGVELTTVENGEEAVQAVLTERFDVVLMDMQMPVMDGLTAIRAIRAHERETLAPRLPVFTLSANAMGEHVDASMAAGADKHLTKPITAAVLMAALGEIAEQVALREAA